MMVKVKAIFVTMCKRFSFVAFVLSLIIVAACASAFELRSEKSAKKQVEKDSYVANGFRDCAQCPEVTIIPAGSFIMGANSRYKYERPAHKVTIANSFAMGKYEVTFDEWAACLKDGGCKKEPDDHQWGRGKRPVVNINFEEAKDYVRWLSDKTGYTYRLPTEAEWEYAARGGTATQYSWGDQVGTTNANCRTCAPDISKQTFIVGTYKPNPFGLYDVHGNVWEWVEDCWNKNHDAAPTDGAARLDGDCRYRVNRSGSWYYVSTNVRSAYRAKFPASAHSYGIGLRVLRELEKRQAP